MPVLRQHHERDYTIIPNPTIRDQRLSCRDLGLLVRMLQKPPEWKFTKQTLLAELEEDGERSVQSGMKRLQELGYLEITREHRQKGKIARSIWTVRDTPQLRNASVESGPDEQTAIPSPQLRYPSTENAAGNKIQKRETAVRAVEGGAQLPSGVYFDAESGQWRKGGR